MKISEFEIEVERKAIRNIHLSVYPPNGKVHVSVPENETDEELRMFLFSKLSWMREQVAAIQKQERQDTREYVTGENHYLFGQRYLLKVIPCDEKAHVLLNAKFLEMHIRPDASMERRAEVLNAFYRERLRVVLSVRLVQWGGKLGENVDTFSWSIIKMNKQWGSCITEKRKIQFNLLLARVPLHCIDYIVVHEICHLKVHRHDKLFIKLLNQAMPEWRNLKKELDDFVTLPME